MGLFYSYFPIKKGKPLAINNNHKELTWSSDQDHKEVINITFTRWG